MRKHLDRQLVATLLAIVCVLGMSAWMWAEGNRLGNQGKRLSDQQRQLRVAQRQLRDEQLQVQRGRRFALGVGCAVESAVAQAGRLVLLGSGDSVGSKLFIRNLEALGYRPPPRGAARRAADDYVHHIAKTVQRQVGVPGRDLVNADGSIDCTQLAELAHLPG